MAKSEVVEYLGDLIVANISEDNKRVEISQRRLHGNEFKLINEIHHFEVNGPKFKTSAKRNLLECILGGCVYFHEWGIELPCFVVIVRGENKSGVQWELYLFAFFNNTLEPLKSFALPFSYFDIGSTFDVDMKLLDGPTIICNDESGKCLHVCNYYGRVFKRIDFKSFGIETSAISKQKIVSCSSMEKNSAILLVEFIASSSKVVKAFQIFLDGSNSTLDQSNNLKLVMLPREYWEILTVFTHGKVNLGGCTETLQQCFSEVETFSVFATENRQLLISRGNNNLCCYNLPFGDSCKIEIIEVIYNSFTSNFKINDGFLEVKFLFNNKVFKLKSTNIAYFIKW